eukprot:3416284-Rhodomonas_salina.4
MSYHVFCPRASAYRKQGLFSKTVADLDLDLASAASALARTHLLVRLKRALALHRARVQNVHVVAGVVRLVEVLQPRGPGQILHPSTPLTKTPTIS